MDKQRIQILHLEDNLGDARLVKELLSQDLDEAAIEFSLVNIVRLDDALAALAAEPFDIVLADLTVPDSRGLNTVQQIRRAVPTLPVIVMSGLGDETFAVQAVQEGAQDYLVKGRMDEYLLTRAIRYAIERKRAEEILRESNAFNESLLQTIPMGIDIVGEAGHILFMNRAMESAVGQDALGKQCWLVYRDDKQQCAACPLLRPVEVGVTKTIESVGVLGGKVFEITHTGMIFRGQKAVLEVFHDITTRKEAESLVRQSAARAESLVRTASRLNAQLNMDAVLEAICEETARALDVSAASIILRDETRDAFNRAADFGMPIEYREQFIPVPNAIFHKTLQQGVTATIFDSAEMFAAFPNAKMLTSIGIRSLAASAMLRDGQAMGSLNVFALGQTRQFTQDELALLKGLADQATQALVNARLFQESEHRLEQMSLLYDAGLTLNRELDLQAQQGFLLKIIAKALGAWHLEFFRYDPALNELRYELGEGYRAEEIALLRNWHFSLDDQKALVCEVARNRLPLYLPDVSADPRWVVIDPAIHSALMVPVEHEQKLFGVLSAFGTQGKVFTPQDERLLILFANQIAVALENARLFSAERRRRDELGALYALSRDLANALDSETVADLVVRCAVEKVLVTFVRLFLIKRDEWVVAAALPKRVLDHNLQIGQREPLNLNPYCQRVLEHNEAVIIQSDGIDLTEHERETCFLGLAQTVCLVPLRIGDRALGMLMLGEVRSLQREPFTPEKFNLACSIGDQAASALHRVALHAQTERRLQESQALYAIDLAITGSLDIKVTLNVLLEQLVSQLRVDAAVIHRLNPYLQTIEYAAGRGFRSRAIERTRLRVGEGYAGRAVLERRIVTVPNLATSTDPFLREAFLTDERFVSYYGMPLMAKGQVKGVLEIFHRALLSPDPEWLNFLQSLSTQAAIAMDNADLFHDLQHSNVELGLAYDATIEGWSHALDLRDKETEGHTQRVTELTERLARMMGIGENELIHVRRGALLHDIGKMGVPDVILLKPGKLTEEEWAVMKLHPTYAYEMLSPITYLHPALGIPYCHHEKWDGTGYPRGLIGEQIPLAARLFAIVDVWDAVCSDRPYRTAWSAEKARAHILEQSGLHFDPQVVDAFMELMQA